MNESEAQDRAAQDWSEPLVFAFQLDAPPEKVWRALSIPEFRERWLPADVAELTSRPGEEVCYRLTETDPPFLDSVVTFQLTPKAGGTELLVIHRLRDAAASGQRPSAANGNQPRMQRAA